MKKVAKGKPLRDKSLRAIILLTDPPKVDMYFAKLTPAPQ